ncbi:MAG: hypothetical protein V4610_08365 [Pseudomonadota bacterium]
MTGDDRFRPIVGHPGLPSALPIADTPCERHRERPLAIEYVSGDVLAVTWDGRPIRVIQADAVETFYDVEWNGGDWGLKLARTATFYRMRTDYLRTTSRLVGSQPLSEQEHERLRPDLPMRLFQHQEADWSDNIASLLGLEPDTALQTRKLAIIPFGPKGAAAKAHHVLDDAGLSLWRLIEGARRAQEAAAPDVEGVGVYRSGIAKNVPSYYLWGAVDRAGHAT